MTARVIAAPRVRLNAWWHKTNKAFSGSAGLSCRTEAAWPAATAARWPWPSPSMTPTRVAPPVSATTQPSPDSSSPANGCPATAHSIGPDTPVSNTGRSPFLHDDRGAPNYDRTDLEFIHDPPGAGQPQTQARAGAIALSQAAGDAGHPRSGIDRLDDKTNPFVLVDGAQAHL